MARQRGDRTVVTIELETGADPPEGVLLTSDEAVPFAGWLGLALALEKATGLAAIDSMETATPTAEDPRPGRR